MAGKLPTFPNGIWIPDKENSEQNQGNATLTPVEAGKSRCVSAGVDATGRQRGERKEIVGEQNLQTMPALMVDVYGDPDDVFPTCSQSAHWEVKRV